MLGLGQAAALLIASALVLAHLLLCLRSVPSSGPRAFAAALWQQLARQCLSARRLVTDHHESGDPEEDSTARATAKQVADAVEQRKAAVRLAFCRNTLHVGSVFFVASTCMNIWWDYSPPVPAVIVLITCYLLLLLQMHCPGDCSWRSSRFIIAVAALVVQYISGLSQDLAGATIVRFAVYTPARVAAGMLVLDTPYVCVLSSASSVLFGAKIYGLEGVDGLASWRVQICLGDAVATLFTIACSWFFQEHIITSYRHAIELKASKSEAYATAQVLEKMCDAVVHLDEHFHVAAKDASLASLLLHGRGYIQTGSDFLQYLYTDTERGPFRDWLKAPPNRCEEHVAFETSLRDSAGSAIAVEMFNVPFETVAGASHNFLGIREKVVPSNAHPYDGQVRVNDDGLAALRGFDGTRPRSRRARRSSASSDSSSSSGSGTRSGVQEIDSCPVFQFDATNLKILDYSPGFAFGRHRPPPRGSSLLAELPSCDVNREFLRNYDACAADIIQRSRAPLSHVEAGLNSTIVFECRGDRFRVEASIKMEAFWEPGADPGDHEQVPRAVGTAKVLSVIRDSVSSAASNGRSPLQL